MELRRTNHRGDHRGLASLAGWRRGQIRACPLQPQSDRGSATTLGALGVHPDRAAAHRIEYSHLRAVTNLGPHVGLISVDEYRYVRSDVAVLLDDMAPQPWLTFKQVSNHRSHVTTFEGVHTRAPDYVGEDPGQMERDVQPMTFRAPIRGKAEGNWFQLSPLSSVTHTLPPVVPNANRPE